MARPSKSLQERIRDRSFLARRHGALLAGPLVGPERLREIQRRWQEERDEVVRRALEREYEKLVVPRSSVGTRLRFRASELEQYLERNREAGP